MNAEWLIPTLLSKSKWSLSSPCLPNERNNSLFPRFFPQPYLSRSLWSHPSYALESTLSNFWHIDSHLQQLREHTNQTCWKLVRCPNLKGTLKHNHCPKYFSRYCKDLSSYFSTCKRCYLEKFSFLDCAKTIFPFRIFTHAISHWAIVVVATPARSFPYTQWMTPHLHFSLLL